jgi:hypothetical protein
MEIVTEPSESWLSDFRKRQFSPIMAVLRRTCLSAAKQVAALRSGGGVELKGAPAPFFLDKIFMSNLFLWRHQIGRRPGWPHKCMKNIGYI